MTHIAVVWRLQLALIQETRILVLRTACHLASHIDRLHSCMDASLLLHAFVLLHRVEKQLALKMKMLLWRLIHLQVMRIVIFNLLSNHVDFYICLAQLASVEVLLWLQTKVIVAISVGQC